MIEKNNIRFDEYLLNINDSILILQNAQLAISQLLPNIISSTNDNPQNLIAILNEENEQMQIEIDRLKKLVYDKLYETYTDTY